jgi:DNA-binding GntR family transcriptional regulator
MTLEAIDADHRDPSKTEWRYADLRRRIRELAMPPGASLREEEISVAALGLSRAPVSEAIAHLAEHRRIVDANRPHDGEFAAAAMRAHLSMVGRAIGPRLEDIEAAR